MFNDDLTKHEQIYGKTPAPQVPTETMPEDLPVEDVVSFNEEDNSLPEEIKTEEEAPEIIEINITPEAVAAAENSNLTFGEEPVQAESAPALAPAPEAAEEPAPKAKDKKQLKEEKRRKKLDKLKKIRRTGLTSGDGNDIDLYPED